MGGDEGFATPEEVRTAINALDPASYVKLMVIAKAFCRRRTVGSVVEPEDLIHDAIAKTLDGPRRWNRAVSILKHLDRTIESDSGHEVERREIRRAVPLQEDDVAADRFSDAHAGVDTADELDQIFRLFKGDRLALDLLRLRSDGYSASEIQVELGLDETRYESLAKKIRRRVTKHLNDGQGVK